jgi:hypothetical protein
MTKKESETQRFSLHKHTSKNVRFYYWFLFKKPHF